MPAPSPATATTTPSTLLQLKPIQVCFENSISKIIHKTSVIDCLLNLQTNRVDMNVILNYKQSFILAGIGVKVNATPCLLLFPSVNGLSQKLLFLRVLERKQMFKE